MSDSLRSQSLVFIGAGSMAEAIVRGLIEQNKALPDHITLHNRNNTERLSRLNSRYGVQVVSDHDLKKESIRNADILVLAMKPKDIGSALAQIREDVNEQQFIVSVAAGVSIATIERLLERRVPIARTMPNTSSTIGLGATGISFSDNIKPEQKALAVEIFESIGIVSEVAEPLLDTVTGVSGSGPAYIYFMMEAMIAGGMKGGLSKEEAHKLTVQTVLGAAQMVKLTGEDPAELRTKVTSPNGTTQAALDLLRSCSFPEAVEKAVLRAAERAREIGAAIASH